MKGRELNLTIHPSIFTWGVQLKVHGDQDIDVKMDMDVKHRNELVFPGDFKEKKYCPACWRSGQNVQNWNGK